MSIRPARTAFRWRRRPHHGSTTASANPAPGSNRPAAILICYSCGPGAGSEFGAGWTWTKAASEVADIQLLSPSTQFRPLVESAIAELELPISVTWVDIPAWLDRLLPGKVLGMVKYCIWHAMAARVVRRIERRQRVDIAHHVTWASDSLPSALLASRAPVRVWGPVGGATRTPLGLYRYLTLRGKAGEVIRDIMNGSLRATFGTRLARHATLIVALNQDVEKRWRAVPTPVVVESNTALYESELAAAEMADDPVGDAQHRAAVFVGRLIPWKGLLLAVESLRHAPGWRLVVMGQGPDQAPATALARRIGVADRLEFRGHLPRSEVLEAFRSADALLFPSFHDASSWAVGEASSLGCPVVCLDAGGPALQAGRNAHVVPIAPVHSLPERIGARLEGLEGRGAADLVWNVDRLPVLLKVWYTALDDTTARAAVDGRLS